MKQLFAKMKLHYYLITLAVVVVLFVITDARPAHPLDDPLIYGGYAGHFSLLFLSFGVSMYLGFINAYRKCIYPVYNALAVYSIVPYVSLIFINQPRVTNFFFSYLLVFGFFFMFLPHIIVSYLGIGFGYLIRKYK